MYLLPLLYFRPQVKVDAPPRLMVSRLSKGGYIYFVGVGTSQIFNVNYHSDVSHLASPEHEYLSASRDLNW